MQSVQIDDEGERGRDSGFFRRVAPAGRLAETRSDEVLVSAMIANEAWAWKEFQRRFDPRIQRCIFKITRRFGGLVGPDDARDIYASLYLSLVSHDHHKLRSFDAARGHRFSSWICVLAMNCAYDHLRTRKRETNRATLAEADELICDQPDPYESAVESERAGIAAGVLSGFSARDRTFATLYFGEGLGANEIASRMNISVKTVYSKKHKIQSRLEAVLTATGGQFGGESRDEAAA